MWIEPLDLERSEDGEWVVTCPNAFSRKRVQEHFGGVIAAELQRMAGQPECRVRYHVAGRCNGQKPNLESAL